MIEDKKFLSNSLKSQIDTYTQQTLFRLYPYDVDPEHPSPFFVADKLHLIDEHETEWIDVLDAFWTKHFQREVDIDKIDTFRLHTSYPNGQVHTLPQKTAKGFCYNFIMCLNDPLDKTSATVILDEGKVQHVCYPEQWKAILFKNNAHFHYYPKVGHRTMMMATIYE